MGLKKYLISNAPKFSKFSDRLKFTYLGSSVNLRQDKYKENNILANCSKTAENQRLSDYLDKQPENKIYIVFRGTTI